ncbi:NAD(P)H-dependent oxidoreductase [Mycolicibacterium palauense]|uniref:NAD(P)H-dependent oxidoreductase n=1 Tax=Mycolicibacterium palauense TaxID=2034511 RepID=UPI000BFEEDAF|nr:NAD(P)H-dependent oxidoreductase [Mycolicibacterium palauense]
MSTSTILVLVGSLRAESVNRRLAEVAVEAAPAGVRLESFDRLGELPFYNEDIDEDTDSDDPSTVAEPVAALRRATAAADAVLVITPEYNGSIPGVLKNAIDWLSRPFGDGAVKGKPVAVVGASHGRYGGVWAHDETRKSLGVAGARVIADLSLSVSSTVFDGAHPRENGEVARRLAGIVGKLAVEAG